MPIYQIGISNRFVRQKIENGETLTAEESVWEDTNYFDIEARDEEHAKRLIKASHKESHGFVIDCIDEYRYL